MVALHLQQQGQPATRHGIPVLQTRRCPVRKSAIGCLLDRYTPVAELTEQFREELLRQSGVNMNRDRALLERLEQIHNCKPPENWPAALWTVANEFNLKQTVLESVGTVMC